MGTDVALDQHGLAIRQANQAMFIPILDGRKRSSSRKQATKCGSIQMTTVPLTLRLRYPARGFLCLTIAVGPLVALGCGPTDGLNRKSISGDVTLDGIPIRKGAILLEPVSETVGTAVGATIRQGSFSIPRREGPVPGMYLVRIYASSGQQAPLLDGQSENKPRPMLEQIPAHYNEQTKLQVEVSDKGRNRFPFELRSIDSPTSTSTSTTPAP